MSLALLMQKGWLESVATAIPAISATDERDSGDGVAEIATVAVARGQTKTSEPDATGNVVSLARGDRTAEPLADELAELREHFLERAAILEFEAGIPRQQAEMEAAKATCILARNRGYAWRPLRAAFEGCPSIQAAIPERAGCVDSLPLGYAKIVLTPRREVAHEGAHRPDKSPS